MAKIKITIDGETVEGEISREQTVLEFGEANGLDLPYSCRGGICSTCMSKLSTGKVEMDNNMILTDGELEEGYILACQSHVITDEADVSFDI